LLRAGESARCASVATRTSRRPTACVVWVTPNAQAAEILDFTAVSPLLAAPRRYFGLTGIPDRATNSGDAVEGNTMNSHAKKTYAKPTLSKQQPLAAITAISSIK
jgi:hypothetical protein